MFSHTVCFVASSSLVDPALPPRRGVLLFAKTAGFVFHLLVRLSRHSAVFFTAASASLFSSIDIFVKTHVLILIKCGRPIVVKDWGVGH